MRAGGVEHPDTHLVFADDIAVGVDRARSPEQHGGRGRRFGVVGVAADRVVFDLGRRPTRNLDAVLGNVADRAVTSKGVAGDIGARTGIVDDDARLLIGGYLVVGDVGRAGRAPELAADADGVAVLAAAQAGVADIDHLVVVDVGVSAVTDEDAVGDGAAATRAGAGDGEFAHLHLDARAGDLDDDRVRRAGVGQGRRGLDKGHGLAVFAQQGQVFIDGDLLDVGAFVDQHGVAGRGVVDLLLDRRPDTAHVVERVATADVAVLAQVRQQI